MTTAQFPHLTNAARCFSQGLFAEAEQWCRTAAVIAPHLPDIYHLSSGIAAQLGQVDAALASIDRAIGIAEGNSLYPWHKGSLLFQLGRRREAVSAFGRSIELNPLAAESWHDVGVALLEDDPDHAFLCLGRSALLQPEFGLAHQELGKLLQANSQHEAAQRRFTRALICQPDNPDSHNDLGKFHYEQRRFGVADQRFRFSLVIDPTHPVTLSNLGLTGESLKRFDDAILWHRRALLIEPYKADHLANLANCLQIMGQLAAAEPLLEQAGALAPDDPRIQYAVAHRRKIRPGDPHIAAWEALAARLPGEDPASGAYLHFALAKAYDDIGKQDRAFDHLLIANKAKRATIEYDEPAVREKFRAIREIFTADFIAARKGGGHSSTQPIFIVGMPRSGSTLVEQILASHPDIFGAGELTDLPDMLEEYGTERGAFYPQLAARLSDEEITDLGARYAARQHARSPHSARVTDKAPVNFQMAGLIHLMLPNAIIIHTRRDPVDTCLSCFSRQFQDVAFSYDLAELGRHWRLYDELMDHWQTVLPQGSIVDVEYEALVADLPGQARRLVEHCGLPWSDDCLAFHETSRPVVTASMMQVRRPIYTDAVGRWRPAETLLKPLLDGLNGL